MQGNNQETIPQIRHSIVMNAPIQKVWGAVSTSEGIAAWFMPNTLQPVLGSEFTITDQNFGTSDCKVIELDPPTLFSFTWGKDWTITFELHELDGKTEFTVIHAGWDAEKVTEFGMPHTMVRGIMDKGWESLVQKLAKFIEA